MAIVGGLGEATHGAVWKYLEEGGIPDLFISSRLHKWQEKACATHSPGQSLQEIVANEGGMRRGTAATTLTQGLPGHRHHDTRSSARF